MAQGLHACCRPGSTLQDTEAHKTTAFPTCFVQSGRLVQRFLDSSCSSADTAGASCNFSVQEEGDISSSDAAGSSPFSSSTGLAFQHASRAPLHSPASQPPRAMPERDGMEGHSMAEGSVIAPLACPQARTHKWSSRKKVKVCSTAASRPSAKGAAIKNHENKQCGGNTCCPLSAASCSFSPDGGDGGPVTVLSPRAGPRTGVDAAPPYGGEAAVRVSALSLSQVGEMVHFAASPWVVRTIARGYRLQFTTT